MPFRSAVSPQKDEDAFKRFGIDSLMAHFFGKVGGSR